MVIVEDLSKLNLYKIKNDLIRSHIMCSERGLKHSAKWASELVFSLNHYNISQLECTEANINKDFLMEYDRYIIAKSYLDLEEYERAAFFVKPCSSPKAYFIYIFSTYLAAEKRSLESDFGGTASKEIEDVQLLNLRRELTLKYKEESLDGFCLYVYGIILKKMNLINEAISALVQAVNLEPLHWGAWQELTLLITDREMMKNLHLPKHWISYFFEIQCNLELQHNDQSLEISKALLTHFPKSTFLMAQIAQAHHNSRDVNDAIKMFEQLTECDPFRLDNMDIYSNLLYVKESKVEVAKLAHHCCNIDKYRIETCCVIGNYYSLRGSHEKAIVYFQRALKLNPKCLSAWTIMGHEYMELKQVTAAIQAYRQAVEINKKDYRAWYGLGQTYEMFKLPFYSLYYFQQAQKLRPNDSRMASALGEAYQSLGRIHEAKRCFWKAISIGDIENIAVIKLAKLFEQSKEEDLAAGAYEMYLNDERNIQNNYEDTSLAYKYLANYMLKKEHLDDAFKYAQKCLDYKETMEEGKSILRHIASLRTAELNITLNSLKPASQLGTIPMTFD